MKKIERLPGIDAAFLYMETPTQHMHVCGTMILEPARGGVEDPPSDPRATADCLAELIARRISAIPEFRRRIVDAPFGISHPAYFEAVSFHARDHVSLMTVAAPGGPDQLAEVVGRIAAKPLERGRPLWELCVIDGLERGQLGVVLKVHHALVDGVAALGVIGQIFADDTGGESVMPLKARPPGTPNVFELTASMIGAVAKVPSKVVSTIRHSGSALMALARNSVELITTRERPAMLFSSPRTVLNHALTAERVVAFGRVPLATVKRIKTAFGVTVNDVVLTACTRALAQYLADHGETPQRPLVATVPISEHDTGTAMTSANQVSAMFLGLPVHLDDLEAVIRSIHEQSIGAKRVHAAFGPAMLAEWADIAPPSLFAAAVRAYSRWSLAEFLPPAHSLVISNVPGPSEPLYAGGARLISAYPLGPILEGAAVNISVMSYDGAVDIGLIACPRAVPHPAEIARGFERAMEELDELAGAKAAVFSSGPA
jgi:diacylglycerol O-acyltransferase